jgi:K(+)-stimulated pyrophosphate-energized sodium pump
MSAFAHVASQEVALTGTNYTTVVIVALIALAALGVAAVLVRQVLAADEGTDSMKKIALAIKELLAMHTSCKFNFAKFCILTKFSY